MAKEINVNDPRIPEILAAYVDRYMAKLGPYVSCVFFILLFGSEHGGKERKGYVKTMHMSINEIAEGGGMSKRKVIDAIKVLKKCWIVIQLKRKGRGNKSYYYFLPVAKWVMPD